ncbi:MAG: hypothetical protein IPM04_02890 [Saprospiraceae bacterium]|nr:hypothetical protein [Candidatus Brachybacter algidus]MBK8746824.1 hypothetical protein [Candidatus Brachybacter algidus]
MMKKLLHVSCKKATMLVCKKEDGQLLFGDQFRLRIHLSICTACRLFAEQNKIINKSLKNKSQHLEIKLPEEKKQQIKELLIKGEE